MINRKLGIRIIGHDGATLGFSSDLFFLPEHGLGMVVLTNKAGAAIYINLLRRRLLELVFGAKLKAERGLAKLSKTIPALIKKQLRRVNLKPSRAWIKRFVGRYRHPTLGALRIKLVGNRGIADAGEWQAPIASHRGRRGLEVIVLGAPMSGMVLFPRKVQGRWTLTLFMQQKSYVFKASK
jgi:hypothetical protein